MRSIWLPGDVTVQEWGMRVHVKSGGAFEFVSAPSWFERVILRRTLESKTRAAVRRVRARARAHQSSENDLAIVFARLLEDKP
jgi:hypothetical protein